MNKLTSLVIACALLTGCKDKQSGSHAPPPSTGSGSVGAAQTLAADPQWAEKLPAVTGGDTKLLTEFASGLVRITADGTLAVAPAASAPSADPRAPGADPFAGAKVVQLGSIADALQLPPIKARPESAYVVAAGSGSAAAAGNPTDVAFAKLGHPAAATGAPVPARRMTTAFALSHPNDVSGGVMIFADPTASATMLVDVLAQTGGFLAVRNAGKLGALPLQLDRHAPAPTSPLDRWVEVRLGNAIELETVPGAPAPVASLDKLADSIKATGATAVDLLVTQQTKVQDVVAAIEQLRAAGVEAIGIGAVPGRDGGTRGTAGPRVVAFDVFVPGLDAAATAEVRKALEPAFAPMLACYQTELGKSKKRDLAATTTVEIFIGADGKVQGAKAQLAPALTKCVTEAFKTSITIPQAGAAGKATAKLAFVPN